MLRADGLAFGHTGERDAFTLADVGIAILLYLSQRTGKS